MVRQFQGHLLAGFPPKERKKLWMILGEIFHLQCLKSFSSL